MQKISRYFYQECLVVHRQSLDSVGLAKISIGNMIYVNTLVGIDFFYKNFVEKVNADG